MLNLKTCLAITLIFQLAACIWVKVDEGVEVQLVTLKRVENCARLGTTQVTTASKLAGIERSERKLAQELLNLARNSAAQMGGDTVVEQGLITSGSQTFAVYDCGGTEAPNRPPVIGLEVEKAL